MKMRFREVERSFSGEHEIRNNNNPTPQKVEISKRAQELYDLLFADDYEGFQKAKREGGYKK